MASHLLDNLEDQGDEFVVSFPVSNLPFTNWSPHPVDIWGQHFPTAEHAFQYKKFETSDPVLAAKIRDARSPLVAKKLGWSKSIDTNKWDQKREKIMREIIAAKLAQNQEIQDDLKRTGSLAILQKTEDNDEFWGIGKSKQGKNTIGLIWMSLRVKQKPPIAKRRALR